jgi:hypothetical protein
MDSPQALARANRQMMAERAALLAEQARLQTVIAQRSVNALAEVSDGLEQLLGQAGRGDQAAKQLLDRFCKQLVRAAELASPIVIINGER